MFLKFVVTFIMIFLMIIDGSDQINILIDETDAGLCSEKADLIWRFVWRYFKDMHAAEIFAHQDGSLDFSNEIMKCSMKNHELSVQYNVSTWRFIKTQEDRRLIRGEVFYRHKMNGLIFIKEISKNIATILPPIDQDTKVTMILTKFSVKEVNNILKLSWRTFNILDLVIFHIIDEDLYVSIYDPFIIKNNIRGHVHTFLMTNDLTSNLLKIMEARLINVHGYPLKVVTSSKSFVEIDKCEHPNCEITHTIMETLHFDPKYYEAKVGSEWILVEYGRADMTYRLMTVDQRDQRYSISLYPLGSEVNHFIVPKMQPGYTISFVKIFSPVVSMILAFSYVVFVLALRWTQKMNHEDKMADVTKICYMLLGNLLQVSQVDGFKRRYERFLFFTWIIFAMFICYHYQATMVEHLTAGSPSRDMDTMEELGESDLIILFSVNDRRNLVTMAGFMDAPGYYQRILERSQAIGVGDMRNAAMLVAQDRLAATTCNNEACEYFQMVLYSRETGEDLIHIMKDQLSIVYTSLIVPLDSPYVKRFNEILMQCADSGLMQKWQRNLHERHEREYLMRRIYNPAMRNDVYRMKDLYYIFWSWFACCCVCCMILFAEISWFGLCKIADELLMSLLAKFSR